MKRVSEVQLDSNMSDSEDSSSFDDSSFSDSDEEDTKNEETKEEEEEEDEEDPVVKAIKLAKERKPSNRPGDIVLEDVPCNICFHPTEDLITVGSYGGDIDLYSYGNEVNEKLKTVSHGDANSRDLKFNAQGDKLYALLNDKNVVVYHTDGMKVERKIEDMSEEPGTCLHVIDENVFAVGDEKGDVTVWDRRQNAIAFSLENVAEDSISSMLSDEEGKVLVCSSTNGTLTSIKVRAKKVQTRSEQYDSVFNCLGIFKQNTKLAVGDSDGKVYLFNWGEFGYHSDVYPGHSEAVNAMIPITERILLTGGDDGYIRAVNFYPMKFLGIVGKHGKEPVENMDVCNDGHLIASTSHDNSVRFWNVSYLEDFIMPAVTKTSSKVTKAKDMKHNLPSSRQQNASDFFQGLN